MGEAPVYEIVKGPWDKENKRWAAKYGAIWKKEWPDGGTSYSVKFTESPPAGEFLRMIEVRQRKAKPAKPETAPLIDDAIPDFDAPF